MLYKRTKSPYWWVRYTDPNGKQIRRSTGTEDRREAQEYADKLKHEAWRVSRLGDRPRHSWQEAVVRWIDESAHKRSLKDDIQIARNLDNDLGAKWLDEITHAYVDGLITAMHGTGMSNSRINRVMSFLRAVLRKAEREWGWLDSPPAIRRLKEPATRVRWLTREEADRLLHELPPHLEAMVRFTLATGLRAANVTGLRWTDIDLDRRVAWVHPEDSKSGRAIGLPLNNDAVVVLRSQAGAHSTYVFTYRGKPVEARPNNTGWRSALKRAGIDNFRWHDLRHTWASWHVQAGTPLHVLKELGGWASYQMVLRYSHLAPEHLAEHANRLSTLRAISTLAAHQVEGQKESG